MFSFWGTLIYLLLHDSMEFCLRRSYLVTVTRQYELYHIHATIECYKRLKIHKLMNDTSVSMYNENASLYFWIFLFVYYRVQYIIMISYSGYNIIVDMSFDLNRSSSVNMYIVGVIGSMSCVFYLAWFTIFNLLLWRNYVMYQNQFIDK